MYIVEANVDPDPAYFDFQTAYHFVGEEDEIKRFKMNIGSLVLSELYDRSFASEDGFELIRQLHYQNSIHNREKAAFHSVVEDAETLISDRLQTLMMRAMEGALTISDLWEEFEALSHFEPQDSVGTAKGQQMWLTKDGLVGMPKNGELETWVSESDFEDAWGKGSIQARLAQELGLNAEIGQYELARDSADRPILLSDRHHTTLGRLDDEGNFEPVVTTLDEDHPAVVQNT